MTSSRRQALWLLGPCFILVVLHVMLALTRDRPLIFADEAGYIGNARFLAGGLPIKLIKSGAYYPGYSLVIAPVFWLGLSPPHTYQAILIVNGLLLSTSYLSLVFWLRRILAYDSWSVYLMAFAASLYPTFLVQPLFAMSESAVVAFSSLLPLVVFWLIRTKRLLAGIVFGALVAFLYAVHPRYIGTILVSVIGLAGLAITRVLPWRVVALSLFTLGGGVLGGRALTTLVTTANQGTTLSEGGKLKALTTARGIWLIFLEVTGQFWYLGAASAGLVVLGVVAMVNLALARPTDGEKRRASPAWNALVFTCACAALAFGVSCLFLATGERVDHFIYGRYNEGVVAPFLVTGLWSLIQAGKSWRAHAWRVGLVTLGTVVLAAMLIWGRGDAWLGQPNLANILAIIPQMRLFSGTKLLGVSALAIGAYVIVAMGVRWRPWVGIALLGVGFSYVGYRAHKSFLSMQKGRAARQVLFDRVATMPGVDRISYDASYFDPVTLFFGQYFLPNAEFDFFESAQGQMPKSPFVLGHRKWPNAKALSAQLIGKDKWGYSLWRSQECCPTTDLSFKPFGFKSADGIAEEGFYHTEAWPVGPVRWTNGNARLTVPISPDALSISNVYVDIASVGATTNRVLISANGRELFKGKLGKGRSRLIFPLAGVPVVDTLELKIESKTFVPSDASESDDARQLGVAVRSIRIIRECCLAQFNPFDPANE